MENPKVNFSLSCEDKSFSIYGNFQCPMIRLADLCNMFHLHKSDLSDSLQSCDDDDMAIIPPVAYNLAVNTETGLVFTNTNACVVSPEAIFGSVLVKKTVDNQEHKCVSMPDEKSFNDLKALMSQYTSVVTEEKMLEYKNELKDVLRNVPTNMFPGDERLNAEDVLSLFFKKIVSCKYIQHDGVKKSIGLYYQTCVDNLASMTNLFHTVAAIHFCDAVERNSVKFTYDKYLQLCKNIAESPYQFKSTSGYRSEEMQTYLMKDLATGMTKIGRSIRPLERERTLQAEKPTIELLYTTPKNIENKLHKEFDTFRVRGEWFNLSQDQINYIVETYEFEHII